MEEPEIASRTPYRVEVEAGKTYYWCACGRSAKQPFCDGSHAGTRFTPQPFTPDKAGAVFFCGCKRSARQPLCDGSHGTLK